MIFNCAINENPTPIQPMLYYSGTRTKSSDSLTAGFTTAHVACSSIALFTDPYFLFAAAQPSLSRRSRCTPPAWTCHTRLRQRASDIPHRAFELCSSNAPTKAVNATVCDRARAHACVCVCVCLCVSVCVFTLHTSHFTLHTYSLSQFVRLKVCRFASHCTTQCALQLTVLQGRTL